VGPLVGGPVAALIYEFVFKMQDGPAMATPSTPRSQPYDGTGGARANLEEVSILDRTGSRADSGGNDMPPLGLDGGGGSNHRASVSTSMMAGIPLGTLNKGGAGQGAVADWR
jgi:hypothetical protein